MCSKLKLKTYLINFVKFRKEKQRSKNFDAYFNRKLRMLENVQISEAKNGLASPIYVGPYENNVVHIVGRLRSKTYLVIKVYLVEMKST